MQIKRHQVLIALSLLWALLILALGVWWLYLLVGDSSFFRQANLVIIGGPNLSRMVLWEGSTFIVLLLLLSISLFILYLQDQKRTHAMQAFYAGMTHELKSPLASMRLQSEVLSEAIEAGPRERLKELAGRLIEDALRLEIQMDKILQLSRIERGADLDLRPVSLSEIMIKATQQFGENLNFSYQGEAPLEILADEMALELIIKNLVENTKIHSTSRDVTILLFQNEEVATLTYCDGGDFKGDFAKMGGLFYKYRSSKGSGIGLYLAGKLTKKMKGHMQIANSPLSFKFTFKNAQEIHS